jgi:hypothetical protein
MTDEPTSDLAEMTLWGEIAKIKGGMFSGREERVALILSALESLEMLKSSGDFSQGPEALRLLEQKLRKLLAPIGYA